MPVRIWKNILIKPMKTTAVLQPILYSIALASYGSAKRNEEKWKEYKQERCVLGFLCVWVCAMGSLCVLVKWRRERKMFPIPIFLSLKRSSQLALASSVSSNCCRSNSANWTKAIVQYKIPQNNNIIATAHTHTHTLSLSLSLRHAWVNIWKGKCCYI